LERARRAARQEFAEPSANGDGKPAAPQPRGTAATRLVRLVKAARVELWHCPDQAAYASIPRDRHREHWPLRSTSFNLWLRRAYFLQEKAAPSAQALQDALGILEGMALFEGDEHAAHVRVAEHEGRIYLDMADRAWRAVEVDAEGWRVVKRPPVRFRRPRGLLPLPRPVRGGSLAEMRQFLNIPAADAADGSDAAWQLLIGWLSAALRPRGPYPMLVLTGEQGTAKSTLGRLLRSLVDPSVTPLRSEPREIRDLMIAATSGWTVALDNLSHLPQWLSDALCRLSTGGGFATRELYTDREEMLFDATRPALLTSIEEVVTSGDLLDRALFLRLEPIPENRRRTEAKLWAAWEPVRPRVLGALLDAVSAGLGRLPSVQLDRLPRMADFAVWLEAVSRGQSWPDGAALKAYRGVIGDAAGLALEASPVAGPLLALLEKQEGQPWEGAASELLQRLTDLAGEQARAKTWPARPHVLSGQLRRLAPSLRRVGVWVTFDRGKERGRPRRIRIERMGTERKGEGASAASDSVRTAAFSGQGADAPGRSGAGADAPADARRPSAKPGFSAARTLADAPDAPAHPHSCPQDEDDTRQPGCGDAWEPEE
jgi:hypothetical protein